MEGWSLSMVSILWMSPSGGMRRVMSPTFKTLVATCVEAGVIGVRAVVLAVVDGLKLAALVDTDESPGQVVVDGCCAAGGDDHDHHR